MRATGGTPNLINGVSRQPPEVRLTSQLEESVNQFPTVTRGLVPRNPAVLMGVLPDKPPPESLEHLIDRDPSEQYVATISPNGVQVHRLDGTPMTVNTPDGLQYLAGARAEDLQALTVQDHTFILNKSRLVQQDAHRSPVLVKEALVHIVQGDYFTEYSIKLNGNLYATYATEGGPFSDETSARNAERGARPRVIAHMLAYGTSGGPTTLPASAPTNLSSLPTTHWAVSVLDNVIHIRSVLGGDFTIEVEAGSRNRMRAHKGETAVFSELPAKAPDGFCIKISGTDDTNYDDYWVRYHKESTAAEGVWKETLAPNIRHRIDAETMPHLLVREADGTFTFKKAAWASREVGDDATNPWPSFVGHTISGMSFGNNRVGFHSGESLAQSRSGEFFNFWAESILAPLDTDPVDLAVSYPEVSTINHVVPFSGEVILFTSSVPFRLSGGDTLTQKNANLKHLLSNSVSDKVRPVAAGSHLYFVNDTASGCFVHEFSYDRSVDNLTAQSITDHVSGYVPTGVRLMEADGDLKMLVLVSEKEPNTIYVYKWLWIGADKAQSAWQKWTFENPILAMRFYQEELVLVTGLQTSREVLKVNCHEAWLQGGPCPIYLDRQIRRTGTYYSGSDTTVIEVPYHPRDMVLVQADEEGFGQVLQVVSMRATDITVKGDYSTIPVVGGVPYDSYGVLSPLMHRSTNNQGAYGNALPGFQTTISNLRFSTGDTAFLRVELRRDYRKPFEYRFSAAAVGTKTGKHGSLVLGDVSKNVSIMANSGDFRIVFGNIGPYPYSVLAYAWTGNATQTSY